MKYCTIKIRNIGPFKEESSFDIRPLTIFVGRNSSGKSSILRLLAYLNYINDEKIEEEFKINIKSYFLEKLLREVRSLEKSDISTLFNIFISECFPNAYERRLTKIIEESFKESSVSLFRRDSEVYIYSSSGKSVLNIVFENRSVDVIVNVSYEDLVVALSPYYKNCSKNFTNLDYMIKFLLRFLRKIFYIPSLEGFSVPYYFPDCRIMRVFSEDQLYMLDILSRTYYMNLEKILKNILNYVHIIDIILKAEESHVLNRDVIYFSKIVRELLRELGIIDLRAARFGEIWSPLLVMWDGTELRFEELPSGIRQILSIVLSFTLLIADMLPALEDREKYDSDVPVLGPILIEEPEIHMHPSALTLFARLISYIVNLLKRFGLSIIISTHNDYFLYQISNLIALYNAWKKAGDEFLTKYDYHRLELLNPDDVAIYLIQRDDKKKISRIIPIEITEEGIVEDEFYKITEEMQKEHLRAIKYIHMDKE